MTSIKQFRISVPQEKLDLLQRKLSLTTLPDELDSAEWEYGAPLADIKRLLNHWQTSYDWRAHEKQLNDTLPQYTIDIDVEGFGALNVHYVHKQGNTPEAIPLLFCHGWPGHFMEVSKILAGLVDGGKERPAFTVVAPSLPNYAFSEGVKKVRER
jgi:microsomal epoxide hydrolase